jgi:hypothetical protein
MGTAANLFVAAYLCLRHSSEALEGIRLRLVPWIRGPWIPAWRRTKAHDFRFQRCCSCSPWDQRLPPCAGDFLPWGSKSSVSLVNRVSQERERYGM